MSRWFQLSCVLLPSLCLVGGCGSHSFAPPAATISADVITVPGSPPSDPNDIEGREILLRSARAYSGLRSYAGALTLSSKVEFPTGIHHETRRGRIVYRAPSAMRLEANDSNGDWFTIVAPGPQFDLVAWYDGASTPEMSDKEKEVLHAYAGVSLHMSVLLPSFLLDTFWQADLFSVPNGPVLPAQRALGGGGISGTMGRSYTVHDFEVEAIDGEVDDALFQLPN